MLKKYSKLLNTHNNTLFIDRRRAINVMILILRVPAADEKDIMFLEQAEVIIKRRFKDFGGFRANWLVKVTWENMTISGMEKERVFLY